MIPQPEMLPLSNMRFDMPCTQIDAVAMLVGRMLDTVNRLRRERVSLLNGILCMET